MQMSNKNDNQDRFSDYETRKREVDALENALLTDWESALPSLNRYMAHESEELRRDTYALLWRMGRESKDQLRKQAIVEILMGRIQGENEFLRDQLLKWLQDFESSDFNERSIGILEAMPWSEGDAFAVIRLIGIADLKSKLPALKDLAQREPTYSDTGMWYAADEWAALIALARMGDQKSMQLVNNRVKNESDIIVRATILLKDLAYTKQPAAFETLKMYLNSDERLPTTKETVPGILEACYAAALFSQYLENFPIKETDFSEAQVLKARTWVNEQKQWQFR